MPMVPSAALGSTLCGLLLGACFRCHHRMQSETAQTAKRAANSTPIVTIAAEVRDRPGASEPGLVAGIEATLAAEVTVVVAVELLLALLSVVDLVGSAAISALDVLVIEDIMAARLVVVDVNVVVVEHHLHVRSH